MTSALADPVTFEPLSQSLTTYSMVSRVDSLDSMHLVKPQQYIIEISTKPDFGIMTSLLWIRQPNSPQDHHRRVKELATTPNSEMDLDFLIPDESQPDLGMLRLHRDRLATTAEALRWEHIPALERSESALGILQARIELYLRCLPPLPRDRLERHKIRLTINRGGVLTVNSTVIDCPLASEHLSSDMFPPKTLALDFSSVQSTLHTRKPSQVFVDTRPTQPSLFTTHKTTYRPQYNSARARVRISSSAPTDKEVLIYNKTGEVMETSLCTVYFSRHNQWITPAAICGGNLGVTRRLALEKGLCKQGTIEISELVNDEYIWLSNGARGFFVGQICLAKPDEAVVLESGASP